MAVIMNSRRSLIAAVLALTAGASAASEASWKLLREPTGTYTLQYPDTLAMAVPNGNACSNGICRPTEEAILAGPAGSMILLIQRGINPKHLTARRWYESLSRRPIQPSTEILIQIGGRNAIRRGPLIPGTIVHIASGRQISRASGLLRDNTIFVPVNRSDILTISLRPKNQSGADLFRKILETISFPS